jgi:hypothetical protein
VWHTIAANNPKIYEEIRYKDSPSTSSRSSSSADSSSTDGSEGGHVDGWQPVGHLLTVLRLSGTVMVLVFVLLVFVLLVFVLLVLPPSSTNTLLLLLLLSALFTHAAAECRAFMSETCCC